MCGIIGYTGRKDAVCKITQGLSVLEYRGYDSAGIAVQNNGIDIVKCRGRVDDLCKKLAEYPLLGNAAIGHTRWATHGEPNDTNAHPHRVGRVTLVHNGIIENYRELSAELGYYPLSQTDTEIAAALINDEYTKGLPPVKSIKNACAKISGTYAFAILFEDRVNEIYAVRQGSPLLLGESEDGIYLASDMTALLPFTRRYHPLSEGVIACLSENSVEIYSGEVFHAPEWELSELSPESARKGGFSHFMLKEIYEQPEALRKAISPRLEGFSCDGIEPEFWENIKEIQIVACGSATHAGMVGAHFLEKYAGIRTTVHTASEYRYYAPPIREGTCVILVSQSGETADTLAALRYAKSKGLPTLAIVNVVESSIAREADKRIYTYAGPEIAVATTKGYCTQAVILILIALMLGKNSPSPRELLERSANAVETALSKNAEFIEIAENLKMHSHVFFIGRGLDYALALEGALKLKEISYIHAEAYPAGELKHGTISLIEPGTPVIALACDHETAPKTESNIREVESRGADVLRIEGGDDEISSFFSAMTALQLIAYETARARGCDIDKPRNLAKSVTVE